MDNRSFPFADFNKLITMFPDKIDQIPLYIWLCFYRTDHKFLIFWKQFSLALKDEQINP